jgi:hypothetical protein
MTAGRPSPETLEGRLIAQRKVLAALVAAVMSPGAASRKRLRLLIGPDAMPADQNEDPGAVPDRAFAVVGATAEELRLIGEAVARATAGAASDEGTGPPADADATRRSTGKPSGQGASRNRQSDL